MTQIRKNVLTMALLAALAGGAGLYAWFGVREGEQATEKRKAEEAKLVALGDVSDPDSPNPGVRGFTRIELTAKGETTILERQGEGWRMVAPVKAGVDKVAVDGLVSQLLTGKIREALEEKPTPDDLRKYGLDQPRFRVKATVEAAGGSTDWVLRGGIENTFDGSVFLLRGDDGKVYTGPGGLRWSLEKTSYDLRDKEILAVPETKLTRIEVKAPHHTYALARGAENKIWRITSPIAFAADTREVTSLATALKNHRATSFVVDGDEVRKKLGFDRPAVVATFTLESGDPIRLILSQVDEDGATKVYALREQGQETILGEVPSSAVGAFDKDPVLLRDRSVLTFDKAKVDQLVFRNATGAEIAVQRVRKDGAGGDPSEDWKIIRPEQGPAKKFKLASILWTLGSLKAAKLGEENPKSWAQWGLETPEREVLLLDREGKQLGHLKVGSAVPDQEIVRYMRGSRDQVMEVDAERLKDLPDSVDALLDRPTEGGAN